MRARYLPRIGTVRYRYLPVLGMRIIYRSIYRTYTAGVTESDAALDATAAVQGKQSVTITSIHDGKHKYHSPK